MAPIQLPPQGTICLLTLLSSSVFLHILGIFCLLKYKSKVKNPRIVLINLSSVELLTAVFMIIMLSGSYLKLTHEQELTAIKVQILIYHFITLLLYGSMTLISVDRLILVLFPMRYHRYMQTHVIKYIVIGIWVSSFLLPLPFAFNSITIAQHKYVILYSAYTAQGIFLITSVITYSLVSIKLRYRKELGKVLPSCEKKKDLKKRHLMPFLIIFTFIVFYQIPQYIKVFGTISNTIKMGITYVGLLLDPLIYIFSRKPMLRIAYDLLTMNQCTKCRHSDEERERSKKNRTLLALNVRSEKSNTDISMENRIVNNNNKEILKTGQSSITNRSLGETLM